MEEKERSKRGKEEAGNAARQRKERGSPQEKKVRGAEKAKPLSNEGTKQRRSEGEGRAESSRVGTHNGKNGEAGRNA